ncbi:hypothetical protein BHM03_00017177 [Ensete ventricosum]|nr:hypothetical protein BHM03_00017177 [Ensete ventricosum]
MRVDFPRREEGDLTGWLSYSERYFRYYRTPEASMVDIAVIHLEGDTIQWFEILSNLARDWSDEQLLGTFIEGLKLKIREVKARQPSTFMAAISFARIQEERLNQDARRTRTTPRPATYKPSAPSAPSRPSLPKKLTIEELRDRSTKGLCWHCDEPWSRDYRCKKGRLLLIEPIEDSEKEVQEHEEERGGFVIKDSDDRRRRVRHWNGGGRRRRWLSPPHRLDGDRARNEYLEVTWVLLWMSNGRA